MSWADGMEPITNDADTIDSREVIARIEYLEEREENDDDVLDEDERRELTLLRAVAKEAEDAADWSYGEQLIRESYFTDYIEELVSECYEMPDGFSSSEWPWRHMTMDWKAAADEAKADYQDVDFDGVTYLIRSG